MALRKMGDRKNRTDRFLAARPACTLPAAKLRPQQSRAQIQGDCHAELIQQNRGGELTGQQGQCQRIADKSRVAEHPDQ